MGRKNRRYPGPLDVGGKSRPQEVPLRAHRMATQAWGGYDTGRPWGVKAGVTWGPRDGAGPSPGTSAPLMAKHARAPPGRGPRADHCTHRRHTRACWVTLSWPQTGQNPDICPRSPKCGCFHSGVPHSRAREGHGRRENSEPRKPDESGVGLWVGKDKLGAAVHEGHRVVSAGSQPGGRGGCGNPSLGAAHSAPTGLCENSPRGCSPRDTNSGCGSGCVYTGTEARLDCRTR